MILSHSSLVLEGAYPQEEERTKTQIQDIPAFRRKCELPQGSKLMFYNIILKPVRTDELRLCRQCL